MASPSVAVSQTFAYSSGNAENHLSESAYYSTIIVENATTAAVNVAVDGGTAVAGAGTHMETVAPGESQEFDNLKSLPNANTSPNEDMSESVGWTPDQGWVGTALTYCSVIPQASTSGEVTISFQ